MKNSPLNSVQFAIAIVMRLRDLRAGLKADLKAGLTADMTTAGAQAARTSRSQYAVLASAQSTAGFTLTELMVVVVIIGIMSSTLLPAILNQANKAREAEAKSYINSVNRAQQAYFTENNQFAAMSNLGVTLSGSRNYSYASVPVGTGVTSKVDTTATPLIGSARGYSGKVWIEVMANGDADVSALICASATDVPPTISGTVCP